MFENQTYETILARMLARVSDKYDKREGSVIWDTHSPTAFEFQILYVYLETLISGVLLSNYPCQWISMPELKPP